MTLTVWLVGAGIVTIRHMSKKSWIAVGLGALLAWAGMGLADAALDVQDGADRPLEAQKRTLQQFTVDPSWVHAGTPLFRATETTRSADGDTVVGLWECEGPTTFEWRFGMDEDVHLLQGRVEVEYQGRRFVLEPGSEFRFRAGTRAVWRIEHYASKVYTLHRQGLLARVWRRVTGDHQT